MPKSWLFVLVIFTNCSCGQRPNLVTFPEGWQPSSSLAPAEIYYDSRIPHGIVRITSSDITKSYIQSPWIEVAPGEKIDVMARTRYKDVPKDKGTIIVIAEYSRDGIISDDAAKVGVAKRDSTESGWQKIHGTVTVPEGQTRMRLRLGFSWSQGTSLWDDVTVTAQSPVVVRCDVPTSRFTPAWESIPVSILNRTGQKGPVKVKLSLDKESSETNVTLTGEPMQKLSLPIAIAKREKAKLQLALFRGAATQPVSMEVRNVTVPYALSMSPPIPTHWAIEDGAPAVVCDVELAVTPAQQAGATMELQIISKDGTSFAKIHSPAQQGIHSHTLKSPALPQGDYIIRTEFKPKTGKPIRLERPWHVIPRRLARVIINSAGYPEYDGKAIFPLGIYNGGRFEEQGKAGFTVTHAYNAIRIDPGEPPPDDRALEYLDKSYKNGMKMCFIVPEKLAYIGDWDAFRRRIRMFRNHPGLLCWDEEESVARGYCTPDVIATMIQIVREEDPNHPFMVGDCRDVPSKLPKDRSDFFPVQPMDLGQWWWYPFPLGPNKGDVLGGEELSKSYELAPPSFLVNRNTDKPIWVGIQSYKKGNPPRFPTPIEYRAQAYLGVVAGAKGMMYYGGSTTNGMFATAKGAEKDPKPKTNAEEAHWNYLQSLATELRSLFDAFIMPSDAVTISPAESFVSACIKRTPHRTVLIAVNRNNQPVEVTITSDKIPARAANVIGENRQHSSASTPDQLRDHFEPYIVHVYEWPTN